MLSRVNTTALISNPQCFKAVDNLDAEDFRYYDKDGFELNLAEQRYYAEMSHPIWSKCLNHYCWQEPWFEIKEPANGLILDHSIILHRCRYTGDALEQLKKLKDTIPTVDYLIRTKPKWGFDIALDAVSKTKDMYEVLHVEYDSYNYEEFCNRLIGTEYVIRHTDWDDAAQRVWTLKDQWYHLKGFEQNHWKAKYLLGWNKAEYTEKTI
jgi:hypothetical protein